jgi:hypothetical protein
MDEPTSRLEAPRAEMEAAVDVCAALHFSHWI